MAEPGSDHNLSHLRHAVEHNSSVLETILRTLQDLHSSNLKLDRRVGALEINVADILTRTDTQNKKEVQDEPSMDTNSNEIDSTKILFSKDGLIFDIGKELNGKSKPSVESLATLTKEVHIGSVFAPLSESNSTANLASHLNNTEGLPTPIGQVTLDMKKMSTKIEALEKGLGCLNNKAEKNAAVLKNLESNQLTKSDLSEACKGLAKSTRQQVGCLNENVLKTKYQLANYVTSLDETIQKNSSEIKEVRSEFLPGGRLSKIMSDKTGSIIDQVVTESQIVREILEERRILRKSTTCDFHVSNFSELVGTGEQLFSRVWFIDQIRRYVKGFIHFKSDQSLTVWLVHGVYPMVTGLEPRKRGMITVKVTVIGEEETEDWELEKRELSLDETGISVQSDGWKSGWGCKVGQINSEQLLSRGLVKANKLVLRYQVDVK